MLWAKSEVKMSYELNRATPILPANHVVESMRFYAKLGFQDPWLWTDDGDQIRDLETNKNIVYAGFDAPFEIHFNSVQDTKLLENTTLRIDVTGDLTEFYEHCRRLEVVHPNGKLEVKPWGRREFAVLDPSGVCVYFWQDVQL
jgi:hypothetical protein